MRFLILISLFFINLFAHPHSFIDVYVNTNNKNKITFTWMIDEMTSSMLMMELDANQNEKVEPSENTYIKQFYFDSLVEYDYYTRIVKDGKKLKFKPINFSTSIVNGRVSHTFDVIIDTSLKNLQIDFYDKEFFVAMIVKKEFITSKEKHSLKEIEIDFTFGYKLSFL